MRAWVRGHGFVRPVRRLAFCAGLAAALVGAERAEAVEGGLSAYLLGSRDSFAGIVPPAGFYGGVDLVFLRGSVDGLSLGGLPITAETDLDLALAKISLTRVFDTTLWGGTPGVNVNIPLILDAGLSFTSLGPPDQLVGARIDDHTAGLGDITVTPMLGWHSGNWHWSAALSVFAPTGRYDTATVDVAARSIDVLSNGKGVWSAQPVLAATWLDPARGLEVSGAASVLFTQYHEETEYQTAPALTFEGAVLQHLPSGWALGLSGYAYQQTADDSGDGADATRAALGADSLQARVYGLGPIVSYSGANLFGKPTSLKLHYTQEFGARRRFESEVLWLNVTMAFRPG